MEVPNECKLLVRSSTGNTLLPEAIDEVAAVSSCALNLCGDERKASPLISLCIIARDNELTIGATLESAIPWVDEIIVVDTGSKDRTIDVAKSYGARVEYFQWCDDFSRARNYSLQFATGQWVLWIDTDDVLPAHCGAELRHRLQSDVAPDVYGFILQVFCPTEDAPQLQVSKERLSPSIAVGDRPYSRIATEQLRKDFSSLKGVDLRACSTAVDHVKVFRNGLRLAFEGRIHEQVLPSIRSLEGRIEWTPCYVIHAGSDGSEAGLNRKLARDLRLLRMDVQERPEHSFVWFNLGMTLLHQDQFQEAVDALLESVRLAQSCESHLRKAYALLVDSIDRRGDLELAKQKVWEGLGRFPSDPELSFKLGHLLLRQQDWDGAIEAFDRIPIDSGQKFFSSFDPGILRHKRSANMAVCYSNSQRPREALACWKSCIEYSPNFADAWEQVYQLSRDLGDYTVLQEVLSLADRLGVDEAFITTALAQLKAHSGDHREASSLYYEAIEFGSNNPVVLNEIARHYHATSQWVPAIPVLKRLCELDPTSGAAYFNLGVATHQLGYWREASKYLLASLTYRPGHEAATQLLNKCQRARLWPSKPRDSSRGNILVFSVVDCNRERYWLYHDLLVPHLRQLHNSIRELPCCGIVNVSDRSGKAKDLLADLRLPYLKVVVDPEAQPVSSLLGSILADSEKLEYAISLPFGKVILENLPALSNSETKKLKAWALEQRGSDADELSSGNHKESEALLENAVVVGRRNSWLENLDGLQTLGIHSSLLHPVDDLELQSIVNFDSAERAFCFYQL